MSSPLGTEIVCYYYYYYYYYLRQRGYGFPQFAGLSVRRTTQKFIDFLTKFWEEKQKEIDYVLRMTWIQVFYYFQSFRRRKLQKIRDVLQTAGYISEIIQELVSFSLKFVPIGFLFDVNTPCNHLCAKLLAVQDEWIEPVACCCSYCITDIQYA